MSIVVKRLPCIIKTTLSELFPFHRLLDNSEWYKDKNIIDFLSEVGRKFRMSQMLAKHR